MPPVTVVDEGSVGPYDYVNITINPDAADLVGVALEWLRTNGYDVPEMGGDVLRPYLESGMNLLAFRLTKGNDAGSIRPVKLSFGPGLPSIPLRPTAIATQPDMGIMVWVLGESRAIPANYKSLELNEALINWISPNTNYNDVVTRAANEAQGQGFVTEMAGASAPLGETIWQSWEAGSWADIQSQDWSGREGQLLNSLSNFAQLDGMRELLQDHLTVPDGVDEDDFYGCIGCYVDYDIADLPSLEPAALFAAMQSDVIDPILDTQALFERAPYATRLYTTMSAHEMTVDPVFDFNAELPTVSNTHVADRIIECSPSVLRSEAPWRIQLESGDVVRGEGTNWPFATDTSAMPANARVVRVGNTGSGEVVADNTGSISQALTTHNATVLPPSVSGGGCSVSTGRHAAGFFGVLAFGLLALRRRRL